MSSHSVFSDSKYDHNTNYTALNEYSYDDKASSCIQRSESLRGHFVRTWNKITVEKSKEVT